MILSKLKFALIFGILALCAASCQSLFGTSFASETPEFKRYDIASITATATNSTQDSTKKGFILAPEKKDEFFGAVASAQKSDIKLAAVYIVQFHLKSGKKVEIGASAERLFKAKTGVYSLSEKSPSFAEFFSKYKKK